MIFIRSTLFNTALVVSILVLGTLGLPLLVLDRRHVCRLRQFWVRGVLTLLRMTVGLDHQVEGLANVPHGRFIVAAKHQSAWETLALHLVFDDPAIVLKRELLHLPLLGWYMLKVGMVPIDRKSGASALRRMTEAARFWSGTGRPILVFPQGTRVPWGQSARYHPGIFSVYRALGIPVVPVALDSGRYWPRLSWRKYPGRITVRILPAIDAGLGRRAFMQRLETEIETATASIVRASETSPGAGPG